MSNKRKKAAAYHGVESVKFAPKTGGAYATGEDILKVLYAKNLNPSSLLEAAEQYADDRLLFRVPNDKGYDVELGTTAPDPELEKKKKLIIYDPSIHDYSSDKPVWSEILPGHFVYGSQRELDGYQAEIAAAG